MYITYIDMQIIKFILFFFISLIYVSILTSIFIFSFDIDQLYISAHINGTRIQEVIDNEDGIKILFTYKPEKPIIDTFTRLYFSVEDLHGNHINNYSALVTVTNGQRLFKFQNINVTDGDFQVEYIFPDDGTHQVITRIDTKTNIIPASFSVFVPHQAPPNILNPFPVPPNGQYSLEIIVSIILAISIPIAAILALIIVIKRH
jgi:hypothetical protein